MQTDATTDPWMYFVHGTTARLWDQGSGLGGNRGGGELGAGFYTFGDTNWGRRAASAWARRKAVSNEDEPILVRVKLRRSDFHELDREDVDEEAIEAAYNTLYRSGRTGKELVVGPVSKRGPDGRRRPDRSLPLQYKFEGRGLSKLSIDDVLAAL